MKTGIVILNYNSADLVINLCKEICNYDSLDYICVVDNCSPNDDYNKLKLSLEKNKKIYIYKSEKNNGYAQGNNFGISKLIEIDSTIDVIYICNPDVLFKEDVILSVNNFMQMNKTVGACSCAVTDIEGNFTHRQTWNIPTEWQEIKASLLIPKLLNKRKNVNKINSDTKVEVIPGSFFALNRVVINKNISFDENTFLYYEENILFKKLKENGYGAYILAEPQYIHNHPYSSNEPISKKMKAYKIYLKSKRYFFNNYLTNNKILMFIHSSFTIYDSITHRLSLCIKKILKK